jgi:UPF0755 protein
MGFLMKKLIFRIISSTVLLAIIVVGVAYYWVHQPILPAQSAEMVVTVDAGSSVRRAANKMAAEGVPMNPTWFWLLARGTGLASNIHAGSYALTPAMTPLDLLNKMVAGDVLKGSITIIEGWTFKQMRAAIDAHPNIKHDTAGWDDATLMAKLTNEYTHPEGLFFPETYVFSYGASDLVLYRQAFTLMAQHLQRAWEGREAGLPYTTPYQGLIMASIIEKETGHEKERDMIASVFVNRLRLGMRLQTDPTVIYGMGERYRGTIRKSDLLTDTPYNTYTRGDLPPTPIALPGKASLHAAFHPAQSDALYFVAKGDGTSQFSRNLDDHNQAVNKYIRGR